MGKELQMARPERRGRPRKAQLLGSSGLGVSSRTSSRRNKRTKVTTAAKEEKRGKAEDSSPAGSLGAEVEDIDGDTIEQPKRCRPKLNDKDRKPNRGAKRKDTTLRRSSAELGIEWIGSFCPDSQPHFLVDAHAVYGGSLLKCVNCSKHVWLPIVVSEAAKLDRLIDYFGAKTGYRKFLDKNRSAKMLIAKLQDLWYARQRISDDGEFLKLVISTMEDKEYDRKEVIQ